MLEARAFIPEIESARKILDEKAVFKGEYECWDTVYSPVDPNKTLQDEFLRLRVNKKNIWKEKDVILAVKQTEQKQVGKNSIIPLKKEFDTREEAEKYIAEHLADKYAYDFEFTRIGWQYDLGEDQVDIEKVVDLENCYTIEIKSRTEEGLKKLMEMFSITKVITGPTVVEIKKILQG